MSCSRCELPAVTKTRGEKFCASCYYVFVSKKFRTEMSVFRVNGRGTPESELPLLLVFVSLGASSLALVDLLLDMQAAQRQKNTGSIGFRFRCIHINEHNLPISEHWPWPDLPLEVLAMPQLDIPLKSRSSRQDIASVLKRDLIRSLTAQNGAIALVGYSMTKLSELTLSETVKGRGAAIPQLVSPDLIRDRLVFPLRDITLPEVKELVKIRSMDHLVAADPVPPGITKMQSIDEITRQYFANVQQNFPSVVSTVAKAASRLDQPPEPCGLCQNTPTTDLCYACRSSVGQPQLNSVLDVLNTYEL